MTLGDILINVKADTSQLVSGFNKAEKAVQQTTANIKTAIGSIATIAVAQKFIETADSITNVNNQLKLVTKSTKEFTTAQTELFKIAQLTRQKYSDTAKTYSDFALSMGEMGKSQKEILRITESVNKAVAISGGTTQQAAAAIQQLGQAFGSGVLAGDELKSILENSKGLAKAIADGMGVPIGKLKQLGSEGKITAEVLAAALEKSAKDIDEKFNKMAITFAQSWTKITNTLGNAIGKFDEASGITSTLSKSISDLSGYIDTVNFEGLAEIIPILQGIATAMGVLYTASKAAAITESGLAIIRAKNAADLAIQTKILEHKTKMEIADAEAMALGTYAITARTLATEAQIVAMQTHSVFAIQQAKLLATEAASAEAAAIAQTAHARALAAASTAMATTSISATIMATAMKAIPFVAVAATVALLATSFFDASKDANTLTNALSATNDELEKLTENQLKANKISLSRAYSESANDLAKAVNERRFFKGDKNSEEFIALKAYEDTLRQKHQEITKQIEVTNKVIDKSQSKLSTTESKKPNTKALDDMSLKLKDEYYKNAQKKGEEAFEQDRKNAEDAAKKAIKAEEDRLKKSHEIAQSQLKMIQEESDKKIKLQEDYQNTLNDIVQKNDSEKLDGLAKEAFDTFAHYDSLIEKYKEVAGAESALRATQTMAIDTIIKKQKELDEAYNNKTAIDSIDEIYGRYSKLIDAQIELAENGMNIDFDFGDGAKELNNIFKATQQLHVGSMKFAKQDIKLQEDFAKNFLEAKGDELKEKEIVANFDADNAKLKEAQSNAEMAAYSSLAGAMVGAFEKGSAGAIAFTTLQSALGIASSWAAIANAWALPFPANIPAVAMVASAVMPIISQLGGSGGGGGGGAPTTSTGFTFDQNREQIEGSYEPMTDRLDRQIELLESIDRQGSASQLGIELSATSFERDARIWVEDVLEKARQGLVNAGMNATQTSATAAANNQSLGIDVWQTQGTKIGYNESVLRDGTNLIKTLIAMSEESLYTGTLYQAAALEAGYNWSNMMSFVKIEIEKDINEYQNLVSEWSLSVIDSMSDLKDAASDFKGYYDEITGSMFYETQRLNEAFADVDRLRGTASFADYLKTSIDDIKALETFFTEDVFNLLMSNDTADIEAQIAAVEELGRVTGQTFEGGAREALDYLESIELVAAAMARSRENIKSFMDSLLMDEQLAGNLAAPLGVELATNAEELASLFNQLAYDMDGLTDAELDLLNANKALLENTDEYQSEIDTLNESLTSVTSSIGTLDGALGTIESTIEKLRDASRTSEQSLQIYYDAIAEAQRLSTTDLYEDYAKAVSKASDATSALFKVENFSSQAEMDFAQLSAAYEFGLLEDITLEEIDYLKQIEVNTRTQIDVLVAAMNSLGANINSSLTAAIASSAPKTTAVDPVKQSVIDLYNKAGITPDTAGVNYWLGDIAGGASLADVKANMERVVGYSFAVGTPNVPYDMIAQIHKGEMIVPATYNQGIQQGSIMMGDTSGIVNVVEKLITKIETLERSNSQYLARIEYNTTKSRTEGVA